VVAGQVIEDGHVPLDKIVSLLDDGQVLHGVSRESVPLLYGLPVSIEGLEP